MSVKRKIMQRFYYKRYPRHLSRSATQCGRQDIGSLWKNFAPREDKRLSSQATATCTENSLLNFKMSYDDQSPSYRVMSHCVHWDIWPLTRASRHAWTTETEMQVIVIDRTAPWSQWCANSTSVSDESLGLHCTSHAPECQVVFVLI